MRAKVKEHLNNTHQLNPRDDDPDTMQAEEEESEHESGGDEPEDDFSTTMSKDVRSALTKLKNMQDTILKLKSIMDDNPIAQFNGSENQRIQDAKDNHVVPKYIQANIKKAINSPTNATFWESLKLRSDAPVLCVVTIAANAVEDVFPQQCLDLALTVQDILSVVRLDENSETSPKDLLQPCFQCVLAADVICAVVGPRS